MARFPRASKAARSVAAAAGLALASFAVGGAALAAPGADSPDSYSPSEASQSDVPTYLTDRAISEVRDGVLHVNGQDFDHYCRADHQAVSIVTTDWTTSPSTSRYSVPMTVKHNNPDPLHAGNNGLLYLNQWGSAQSPTWRVIWATDFPTTNSRMTLSFDDHLTPSQSVELIPGHSRFRTYDWSTYTLGLLGVPEYQQDHYVEGPYPGVNDEIFSLNTAPNPAPVAWTPDHGPAGTTAFTDDYWPAPNQYVVNPGWIESHVTVGGHEITIELGDQPAGAMIVFTVSATSSNRELPATLTANFTADYVAPDSRNTVCYPVTVTWDKVDADTGEFLPGATFSLEATGDTASVIDHHAIETITGAGSTVLATTDGLQPGTWSLSEIEAPPGYSLATDAVEFDLTYDNPSVTLPVVENTNMPPVVSGEDLTVEEGAEVTPLTGLSAADAEDGDFTASIVVTDNGGFDASSPGTYTVSYSVTDLGGKITEYIRTITVTGRAPTPAPTSPTLAPTSPTPTTAAPTGAASTAPVSPTTSATPASTAPPSPQATASPAASPRATSQADDLPSTGANVGVLLAVAVGLVAVGGAVIAVRRRDSER